MSAITLHHAEQINRAHNEAQAAARSAVQHALEAGKLLLEVKANLEHGALTAWIGDNCRFSGRTARAYMKLARDYESLPEAKRQRVASLPFRDAVRELATPKPLVDLGDIPPADYARATEAQGTLRRLTEFCNNNPPEGIAKAYKPHEVEALRAHVAEVQGWIGQFSEALPRQDETSDSEAHDLLQRMEQQHARFKATMHALDAETDPDKAGELLRKAGELLRDDSLMVEAIKVQYRDMPDNRHKARAIAHNIRAFRDVFYGDIHDDQEPETLAECARKAGALLDRQNRHEQEFRAVIFAAWRHKFGEKKAPFLRWLKDSGLPDRVYSNARRCDVHVGELIAQWRRRGKP